MKRFMSSAASSSSARAEPATTSLGSAEQPGTRCQLQLSSIRDVQRWLAMEPIASCSSADMQRIREAVAVLVPGKPRKEDVRPLQSKWRVARSKNKKEIPLPEVVDELREKVIKAAQQLQVELSGSAEQPAASIVGQPGPMDELSSNAEQAAAGTTFHRPLQRIREATAVLQARPSRQQRQTIQQLVRDWDVAQKTQGCKRKFDEVKSDLASKVADEACRLKRLRHAFEERRTDPSAANANASFSAIQASFSHNM